MSEENTLLRSQLANARSEMQKLARELSALRAQQQQTQSVGAVPVRHATAPTIPLPMNRGREGVGQNSPKVRSPHIRLRQDAHVRFAGQKTSSSTATGRVISTRRRANSLLRSQSLGEVHAVRERISHEHDQNNLFTEHFVDPASTILRLLDSMESAVLARYPKRIMLIRHGQSEGNVDNTVYSYKPDSALELTAKGVAQARQAGVDLRQLVGDESVRFVVSPYRRTNMTFASLVHGGKFDMSLDKYSSVEDPRLREQEWGMFQDPSKMEKIMADRRKIGSFYFRFPEGESGADVYDRVSASVDSLIREFRSQFKTPDNIVIVCHGIVARLWLMRWFHWPVDVFHGIWNLRNCQRIDMVLQASGAYAITDALKAGGRHPAPPTSDFLHGVSTTVPCLYGFTRDEALSLWSKLQDRGAKGSLDGVDQLMLPPSPATAKGTEAGARAGAGAGAGEEAKVEAEKAGAADKDKEGDEEEEEGGGKLKQLNNAQALTFFMLLAERQQDLGILNETTDLKVAAQAMLDAVDEDNDGQFQWSEFKAFLPHFSVRTKAADGSWVIRESVGGLDVDAPSASNTSMLTSASLAGLKAGAGATAEILHRRSSGLGPGLGLGQGGRRFTQDFARFASKRSLILNRQRSLRSFDTPAAADAEGKEEAEEGLAR